MFKYYVLVPVFISLIGCCISADNATTSNTEELNSKCKEKQNIIVCKQEKLKKLQKFLEGLKENDKKNMKPIINDVKDANKLLNEITHNKYNNKELEIRLNKFNNKMKQIEKLYKNLFSLTDQDDDNTDKKIKLKNSKNTKLPEVNNNIQSMTSLNWSKDTRNNSNVITNPFDLSKNNEEGDIIDPECIIVDLSNPITMQQVEEYYNYSNINNRLNSDDIPVQGLPNSKTNDDEISSKLVDKHSN